MMLLVDVDQRFSVMQVLEHPWVNVSDSLPSLYLLLNLHFFSQITTFLMMRSVSSVVFASVPPSNTEQFQDLSLVPRRASDVSVLTCVLTVLAQSISFDSDGTAFRGGGGGLRMVATPTLQPMFSGPD